MALDLRISWFVISNQGTGKVNSSANELKPEACIAHANQVWACRRGSAVVNHSYIVTIFIEFGRMHCVPKHILQTSLKLSIWACYVVYGSHRAS